MSDKIAMLERIPLFAGTDEVTLEQIAELTEVEEVAAGTTLTHEGRHEGYFYMIVAGTVEVSREGVVIDTSGHGGFIGEISLLDLGPRTATATTLTPSSPAQGQQRRVRGIARGRPCGAQSAGSRGGSTPGTDRHGRRFLRPNELATPRPDGRMRNTALPCA